MKDTPISVTEAARNFSDCLNRVRYQNAGFVLLKNGIPLARLSPLGPSKCTGRELASVLARTGLPAAEARSWRRDLQTARKRLKTPAAKW